MSVAVASRLVEERNSSRNLSPAARPVGLRLQSAGTTGGAVLTWKTSESPYMGRVPVLPTVRDGGEGAVAARGGGGLADSGGSLA